MVQVEKDGIVLLIPKPVYEEDYKPYGWKIVGNEEAKKEVKEVASIEQPKDKKLDDKEVKNSNKKK